jgi:hypothetical protein
MSFYDAAVPAYLQMLNSLSGLITKAEAHCKAKNIQPDVILGSRLFPDMLPFSKQIQLVSDFAAKGCARLTHSEVPSTPDTEKSFDELKQRLAKTIDYVKSFKPAQFEGADARDVTFPAGPDRTITMKGQQFLSAFSFPNFYFHAATAHGILRHNGVEIGRLSLLSSRDDTTAASPESILPIVVMDSGPAPYGASRNDRENRKLRNPDPADNSCSLFHIRSSFFIFERCARHLCVP